MLEVGAGTGLDFGRVLKRGASLRLLEHVRMPNRWVAPIQVSLTPIWMRIARGCRLDRDAVEIVTRADFALESVVSHAGGYVVEIVGRPLPPRD